jgi:hypothetical protein
MVANTGNHFEKAIGPPWIAAGHNGNISIIFKPLNEPRAGGAMPSYEKSAALAG